MWIFIRHKLLNEPLLPYVSVRKHSDWPCLVIAADLIYGQPLSQWVGPVTGDVTHLTHHPVLQRQQSASYPSRLQHHRVREGKPWEEVVGHQLSACWISTFSRLAQRVSCGGYWCWGGECRQSAVEINKVTFVPHVARHIACQHTALLCQHTALSTQTRGNTCALSTAG